MKTTGDVSEDWFCRFWQHQSISCGPLMDENGQTVQILYPGRPNDGRGPDFRDAVIISGGRLLSGDIELHVRASDWLNHGHSFDLHYNRVILHVVLRECSGRDTPLQNGGTVPVLALDRYLLLRKNRSRPAFSPGISSIPCSGTARYGDRESMHRIIDRAGDRRFLEKAGEFDRQTGVCGAGETVYRGIMGALGYSGNRDAFLILAEKLPLREIESTGRTRISDSEYLRYCQAALLGTAGFLDPGFQDKLPAAGYRSGFLESIVKTWSSTGKRVMMTAGEWQFFRIRPANSPVRRLMAMGGLLGRYRRPGLLNGLISPAGEIHKMETRLIISAGECLGEDADAGGPEKTGLFLGKNRAAGITVDILLPFAYSMYQQNETGSNPLEVYRTYPGLEENSLTKHMAGQLGLEKNEVRTARRQQGLIGIFREFCSRGRCSACGLSQFHTG